MRVAFIGSAQYDATALASFLWKLYEKHPGATIVTGNGRGAEREVAESARMLGFYVETPPLSELLDPDTAMTFQVGQIVADADIIVLVASGKRPTLAMNIWHNINLHERTPQNGILKRNGKPVSHRTRPIPLFEIAAREKTSKQLAA